MSEMLKSWTWNYKISSAFFVNVFWCNIISWNCYHKRDIYNLIYMIYHMEMIFKAKPCQECRIYFKKKQESLMPCKTSNLLSCICHVHGKSFNMKYYIRTHLQKTLDIFRIQVQDINIWDIFYKIQILKK